MHINSIFKFDFLQPPFFMHPLDSEWYATVFRLLSFRVYQSVELIMTPN